MSDSENPPKKPRVTPRRPVPEGLVGLRYILSAPDVFRGRVPRGQHVAAMRRVNVLLGLETDVSADAAADTGAGDAGAGAGVAGDTGAGDAGAGAGVAGDTGAGDVGAGAGVAGDTGAGATGGDLPPVSAGPGMAFVTLTYAQFSVLPPEGRTAYLEAYFLHLGTFGFNNFLFSDFQVHLNPHHGTYRCSLFPTSKIFTTVEELRDSAAKAEEEERKRRELILQSLMELRNNQRKKTPAKAARVSPAGVAPVPPAGVAPALRDSEEGGDEDIDGIEARDVPKSDTDTKTRISNYIEKDCLVLFDKVAEERDHVVKFTGVTENVRAALDGRNKCNIPNPVGPSLADWHAFNRLRGVSMSEMTAIINQHILGYRQFPSHSRETDALKYVSIFRRIRRLRLTSFHENRNASYDKEKAYKLLREVLRQSPMNESRGERGVNFVINVHVGGKTFNHILYVLEALKNIDPTLIRIADLSRGFPVIYGLLMRKITIVRDGAGQDAGGPRKKFVGTCVEEITKRLIDHGFFVVIGDRRYLMISPDIFSEYGYNLNLLIEDMKLLFFLISFTFKVFQIVPLNLHPVFRDLLFSGTSLEMKEVFTHMSNGLFETYNQDLFDDIKRAVEEGSQEQLDRLFLANEIDEDSLQVYQRMPMPDDDDGEPGGPGENLTRLMIGDVVRFIRRIDQVLLGRMAGIVFYISTFLSRFGICRERLVKDARRMLVPPGGIAGIHRPLDRLFPFIDMSRTFVYDIEHRVDVGNIPYIKQIPENVPDSFLNEMFSTDLNLRELKFEVGVNLNHHALTSLYVKYLNEWVAAVFNARNPSEPSRPTESPAYDENYEGCPYNDLFEDEHGKPIKCPFCKKMSYVDLVKFVALIFGASIIRPGDSLTIGCNTNAPFNNLVKDINIPPFSVHTCSHGMDFHGFGHPLDASEAVVKAHVWHYMNWFVETNDPRDAFNFA